MLFNFSDIWQGRSEVENISQKHDAELIKEEKRKEVDAELRIQVDELMRVELRNLKVVSVSSCVCVCVLGEKWITVIDEDCKY